MVSGPELIQKVFNSDACMEKPHIAYGLFNLDYGLLASTCKLLNAENGMHLDINQRKMKANFFFV